MVAHRGHQIIKFNGWLLAEASLKANVNGGSCHRGDGSEMTRLYSSSYSAFLTLAEGLIMGLSYSHDLRVTHIFFGVAGSLEKCEPWSLFVAGQLTERRGVDVSSGDGVTCHSAVKLMFELAAFGLHFGFEFL